MNLPDMKWSRVVATVAVSLLWLTASASGAAADPHPQASQVSKPYVVEYYYKVKWGHFEEFMELYKKNHFPVLVKEKELGRIVDMYAVSPKYHTGEEARWDFRFTIVWKDAATANDDFDVTPIVKSLYPDQEKFRKEERRRFEILLEHMDVPLRTHDLSRW